MNDEFPHDLKAFLTANIESLAQLETLIRLHHDPKREWTADELARELYISADMCRGICGDLERRRLAVRASSTDSWQYPAGDANVDRLVEQLTRAYRERRVAVITAIYSSPVNKVQTFADAFRLRREE